MNFWCVKYHDEAVAPLRSNRCDKIENLYTRKTIISNDNAGNDGSVDGGGGGSVMTTINSGRTPTNQNKMTALDNINL